MKVLFLDVDGVLNNDALLAKEGWTAIGGVFLDRLKRIIENSNAKIVLSSTWRLTPEDFNLVEEALATRDLKIFDATIEIKHPKPECLVNRSEEILEWLTRHSEVEKFAVLDDEMDAGFGIGRNFFKTEAYEGLTDKITQKVIEHFSTKTD